MSILAWIILATFLGGLVSALVASVFLLTSSETRNKLLPHLVSFAIGALLGAAFLGLLPHAIAEAGMENAHSIGLTFVLGILLFFVLEKAVIWRHCHSSHCEAHTPEEELRDAAAGRLILLGDALHNILDGILIGAAFLTDVHLGLVTALAVFAHEVPQEIGDIVIMLNGGLSPKKSFLYNVLVGFTAILGGVFAYFALEGAEALLPYVLSIAAGSFVYVAVADLIPGLHKRTDIAGSIQQIILIGAGLLLIFLSHSTLH
ncbi:MAG: ZIP family metal transporter [Gammaproteobacteria bacterium]|nr:ZIP family metal transporter [Gammaproteobacteria bacterium]